MSLSVPQFVAPQFAADVPGYAWIGRLVIDFRDASGSALVVVNPDAASAAAGLPPLDTFPVRLGAAVPPTYTVVIPSLAALMQDPAVGPAFQTIRTALYGYLTAHPRLAGATEVP